MEAWHTIPEIHPTIRIQDAIDGFIFRCLLCVVRYPTHNRDNGWNVLKLEFQLQDSLSSKPYINCYDYDNHQGKCAEIPPSPVEFRHEIKVHPIYSGNEG